MSTDKSSCCGRLAARCIGLAVACTARDNLSERPCTVVVPFPPRRIGRRRRAHHRRQAQPDPFGAHFIVENRAGGASGNVGANVVAKAAPDGYTLLLTASLHVVTPFLYKNMPFDVVKDFTPVTLIAAGPLIVSTTPSVPANNLKEFFDLVPQGPAEVHVRHDQYRLSRPSGHRAAKTRGGRQHAGHRLQGHGAGADRPDERARFSSSPIRCCRRCRWRRPVASRRSRSPASKRRPAAPEIPTVDESGCTGFEFVVVVRPLGTEEYAGGYRRQAAGNSIADSAGAPEVKQRLSTLGFEAIGSTPDGVRQIHRRARWRSIARSSSDANIKME